MSQSESQISGGKPVFKLNMIFSIEQFIDRHPGSSLLLVYFSWVLGFSADGQKFLPTKRYTPGLIYI